MGRPLEQPAGDMAPPSPCSNKPTPWPRPSTRPPLPTQTVQFASSIGTQGKNQKQNRRPGRSAQSPGTPSPAVWSMAGSGKRTERCPTKNIHTADKLLHLTDLAILQAGKAGIGTHRRPEPAVRQRRSTDPGPVAKTPTSPLPAKPESTGQAILACWPAPSTREATPASLISPLATTSTCRPKAMR